jgi:hypothetical protein
VPPEIRPLPASPSCGLACSFWYWLPWLVGFFVWLATRYATVDRDLRLRAARSSAALAILWFAVGLASRLDSRSRDLFVYFGLGANAFVLVDFFARLTRGNWNFRSALPIAAAVGLALVPIVHEWPTLTVYDGGCLGWSFDWWDLLRGMRTSAWLPWCSRSLFRVALASMATSASSATALGFLAWQSAPEIPAARNTRIEAAIGLTGSAVLFGICLVASVGEMPN